MKLRKIVAALLVLVMTAMVFAGCGASGGGGEKKDDEYGTVVIQNGDRTLTFTSMPTAVLCANLYSAENMVMLGLGEYIVGKNVHTNPAEVPLPELADYFKDIPEIERSNENAVASGCDLLIGQVSAFKDTAWGTYEQLEAEGIQCLTITGTIVPDETVEDIYTDIRNLGMIFKCEDKAEALIAQMKAEIAATQDIVKDVKDEDKPRVFVFDMYKEDTIYTTAAGLESNLIEMAGGINTTRKMADSRWFYCSVETLVEANPDIIIINDYGSQTVQEKIDYIKGNEACNMIPAVVNDRFLVIPLVDVMQDIRAPRACRTMAEYFYPELFQ
ncbi:MAG: ABC transporter substrate-binding protein [Eubacteriaceae bacterium]|nr:ABC transporter substrate-binding protein [Eubacteriaceae bacterium]